MPVTRDMNGYRDFEVGHLRTSSYGKDDRYGRSGRHNGIDPEFEQNSFDGGMRDGPERTFEVDHLATYTSKSGTTHPEDGLIKLKQMESSTGIWTMRCLLIVEPRHIIVIDKGNGDELERFPLAQVHEPTAVLKNDRRETYNNLILFTIVDDIRKKNSPSDMHIFQSVNSPAHDIVDEILAAKGDGLGRRGPYDRTIPPPPSGPAPQPPHGKSSKYRETEKLADSHRYPGEPDYSDPRRSERGVWESRREGPGLGDSTLLSSSWGPPRFDDAPPDNSRLGKSGLREQYRESRQDDSHLRETRFGESRRNDAYLRETGLRETGKNDSHLGESNFVESRRENNWMSKSLRYGETQSGEPNIGASGRFNDGQHGYGQARDVTRASYIHREDMDTGQNEALERDVQLLNNCFDDIEKFVSRLQQAAESYKELERRRHERRNKRKSAGDGMLTMRARPPPAEDFIDIFQKFKFAFNLLAKLKAHIHDPNAPELVHFLFTPLSLIYEASLDPIHQGEDLSDKAVSPLLVYDAKQLLVNCLTSKELELWQRLGKSWTNTKEDYRGYVQPYSPRFYNGWQPSPQVIDEINRPGPSGSSVNRSFRQEEYRPPVYPEPERYPREEPYARKEDLYARKEDPYPYSRSARENPYSSRRPDRDEYRPPSPGPGRFINESKRDSPPPPQPKTKGEENYSFAQELKRMGATIYEAVHERHGKNAKELTVEKGDILQVLDRSRNWWKLKNYKGDMGYAPYTILKEHQPGNDYDHGHERRSGDYSSYINGNNQIPPPAPPLMSGSSRQGTRENLLPSPNISPRSKSSSGSEKQYTADLHNELRKKITTRDEKPPPPAAPQSPRAPPKPLNISEHSTAEEVRAWLQVKGFSRRCMELLNGYHGIDLFDLEKKELERLLGRDEGKHLDSLLTVQKSNCGYRTRSTAELRFILQRRKERADHNAFPVDSAGKPPSFTPDNPPDYSSDDDDASSDSFGNAGKTLRNLLEKQRKKIQKSQYQQYN